MRAAKRSRLLSVAGVGRVSDKGLQEILEAVRLEPRLLEDNTDDAAIQRAFDSLADSVGTYSIFGAGGRDRIQMVSCTTCCYLVILHEGLPRLCEIVQSEVVGTAVHSELAVADGLVLR